jgi:transposase
LLLRVAGGEALDELNEELGFELDEKELARQRAKYEEGGRTWEAVIDGRHGHAHKIHSGIREYLYARKKEDDNLRAPQLAEEVKETFGVTVSAGHVNYLLRKRELTSPPGRPSKKPDGSPKIGSPTPPT